MTGAISVVFGAFVAAGMNFVFSLIAARHIGPEQFGLFSVAMVVLGLVVPVASAGIPGLLLKEQASKDGYSPQVTSRLLSLTSRLTVLTTVAAILSSVLLAHWGLSSAATATWLLLTVPFAVAIEFAGSTLQARFRFTHWIALHCGASALRLVCVVTLVRGDWFESTAAGVCIAYLVGTALAVAALVVLRGRQTNVDSNRDASAEETWSKTLRRSAPFAASTLLYLVYFQIDILMLSVLTDLASTGVYAAAITLVSATYLLPNALYQRFLMPHIHRLASRIEHGDIPKSQLTNMSIKGAVLMAIAGSVIAVMLTLGDGMVLNWLYGDAFGIAYGVLVVLLICIPVRYMSSAIGATLNSVKINNKVQAMAICAGVNILANAILIPQYGISGAAFSTLLSEAILMGLFFHALFRYQAS